MFIPFVSHGDKKEIREIHDECIWIKIKKNYPLIALTFHLLLLVLCVRIILVLRINPHPSYPPPSSSYPPLSSSYPPPSFVSQDNTKEIGGWLVVQYIWIKRKYPTVALTSTIIFYLDDSSRSNCCEWNLYPFVSQDNKNEMGGIVSGSIIYLN